MSGTLTREELAERLDGMADRDEADGCDADDNALLRDAAAALREPRGGTPAPDLAPLVRQLVEALAHARAHMPRHGIGRGNSVEQVVALSAPIDAALAAANAAGIEPEESR